MKEGHACGFSLLPNTPLYFRDEEIYSSMKALDQVIDEEYASISQSKMKRGQDIRLSICSYVAEKPCGCLYKLTCCNAKFHSLFKCKLYL